MRCKVYLNEARDPYAGFDPQEAELVMAHSFDLDLGKEDIKVYLEKIFEEFNIGEGPMAQAYRDKMLRSLSVGDVVVVGESAWSCDRYGWTKISAKDLQDATVWNTDQDEGEKIECL